MLEVQFLQQQRRNYEGFFGCFWVCSNRPAIILKIQEIMIDVSPEDEFELSNILLQEFQRSPSYKSQKNPNSHVKVLQEVAKVIGFDVLDVLKEVKQKQFSCEPITVTQFAQIQEYCQRKRIAYEKVKEGLFQKTINIKEKIFLQIGQIRTDISNIKNALTVDQKEAYQKLVENIEKAKGNIDQFTNHPQYPMYQKIEPLLQKITVLNALMQDIEKQELLQNGTPQFYYQRSLPNISYERLKNIAVEFNKLIDNYDQILDSNTNKNSSQEFRIDVTTLEIEEFKPLFQMVALEN